MSDMWFTSDIHFGHTNIITYCDRPFDTVHEMNEAIVELWNDTVGPDDLVYVLGDMCMGHLVDTIPLIDRLNGLKLLTPGNHDPIFSGAPDKRQAKWDHEFRRPWSVVQPETWHGSFMFDDSDEQLPVTVSHFPYVGHDDRDFDDHRPIDKGHWLLHGHTHGLYRQRGRMIDVGIDAWGGRLVHLNEIRQLVEAGTQELERIPWRR